MKSTLMLLLSATLAVAGFMPNVRLDDSPACFGAAIAVGPADGQTQPLYVAFEVQTGSGSDIMLQKSTDAGATWLTESKVVRRGESTASSPDITTDSDGDVYIVYTESPGYDSGGHVYCTRSTDAGTTWSQPARIDDNPSCIYIGYARIAADSAGNLLAAWNQKLGDNLSHILSSVSSDQGATWQPKVRLDDTAFHSCYNAEVAIQPGSNNYLVIAYIHSQSYLYRSTDGGQSFQAGVRVDTSESPASMPRIVADREHIICDFNTAGNTQVRTFYSGPDTWGTPAWATELDSGFSSYCNGGCLALSPDGRAHTALMIYDPVRGYEVFYASSTDHGATWSERTRVNDTTTVSSSPDIGADSAGHVYVVWFDGRNGGSELWFSTNNYAAIAQGPGQRAVNGKLLPTVYRRLPAGAAAFDAMGRHAPNPQPGIYFLKTTTDVVPRKVLLVE